MRALRKTFLTAFVTLALAAGCSLANSLDDVVPADDGKFTSVDRPDAGAAVIEEAGPPPVQTDASDGGPIGAGFAPLVVGGQVAVDGGQREPVLAVLDSKSGREIGTREKMWVAALAHDGPRDLWYIFEGPSYFILHPTETVKVHIRRLDATTGKWTELAVLNDLPPLVYYDSVALTNERVSFVVHPEVGKTSPFRLVTLDTSNPSAPKINSTLDLLANPRGIIATRSSAGPGGYLNLYNTGSNPPATDGGTDAGPPPECKNEGALGNVCVVRVRQYLVPNNAGADPVLTGTHTYGRMSANGQPGYASLVCGGGPDDITVLPLGDGNHSVYRRPYLQGSTTAAPRTFTMATDVAGPTLLRRAAVDNIRKLVFVVEANSDTKLHAVPLDPNVAPLEEALQHSGQAVYYDPASETVFAPFSQGDGFTFSPFHVTGTAAAPKLQQRTIATANVPWNPPADLRPTVLGIHQPVDLGCQ